MSRHEGVSCDSCLKGNFRGRRYKCLVCYDYDLCASCYEGGATNTRHTTDHPMQCIITRSDYELYYGGEALTNFDLPQSYTCPYCAKMGFTDVTLQEHVSTEHTDTSFEVVCPLCAAMPGGEPNLMTDDFAGHLTLEHRTGSRDLISFLDEPTGTRRNVRHTAHSTTHTSGHLGRGATVLRPRRSNMPFRAISALDEDDESDSRTDRRCPRGRAEPFLEGLASRECTFLEFLHVFDSSSEEESVFSSGGLSSLSPSARDSVDPIAELLSQLSGVRRTASNTNSSTPTQLQQLQMQLQLERQQVNAARQQLERYPRRQTQNQTMRETHSSSNCGTSTLMLNASTVLIQPTSNAPTVPSPQSQYLLACLLEEMSLQNGSDETRQERSQFVRELILSSLTLKEEKGEKQNKLKNLLPSNPLSLEDKPSTSRQSANTILRGRGRADPQNAKRRADANRATLDSKEEPNDR